MKEGDVLIHTLQEEATNFCEDGNEGRGPLLFPHPLLRARSLLVPIRGDVRETSHGNHGKLWATDRTVGLRSCEVEKEGAFWRGGIIFVEDDPRS